jgi:hypothetical protein
VYPLSDTCDDLGGLGELGKLLLRVFEGVRYVVVLSSRGKAPEGDLVSVLTPYLQDTTEALGMIRKMKLAPEWTNHYKACVEMVTCVSWLYCVAPQSLPVPFIKECMGSSDFWSNRIRKDFKGNDEQIAFCDGLKELMTSLASYVEEYHKTGLSFNPKGVSIEEAAARLTDNPMADAAAHAVAKKGNAKRSSTIGNTVKGGNILGLMSELAGRKNEDGTSAATGLKRVRTADSLLSLGLTYLSCFSFSLATFHSLGHQREANLAPGVQERRRRRFCTCCGSSSSTKES